jgi:phosphomannomutase/phosphoglucomutase
MGRLFGTNGVRGVANKDFTVELVTKLAATIGSHLGKEIALGMDGRITSPMFKDAAISGLLSVGCRVHNANSL